MKFFEGLAAIALAFTILVSSPAHAQTIKFSFADGDVRQMIEVYAKASGKKILVDPGVRGKATIYAPKPVSLDEAFNLLSVALATNGYSIADREDLLLVGSARNMQRNLIPLYKEVPPLKPTRMATMVFELKNASSEEINKRLRILPSKDGEMTPYEPTNQLVVSDWTPNLIRIHELIQELDKPETAAFKAHKK
ncbi:MAG: secretin N-terminal domain-containing protein [Bdellovibrionota bacterium]